MIREIFMTLKFEPLDSATSSRNIHPSNRDMHDEDLFRYARRIFLFLFLI
ncbi:MAG: hypothetical protein ACJA16_004798 [Akkermansiaceae bacterium]|jgi:hypothetical protein